MSIPGSANIDSNPPSQHAALQTTTSSSSGPAPPNAAVHPIATNNNLLSNGNMPPSSPPLAIAPPHGALHHQPPDYNHVGQQQQQPDNNPSSPLSRPAITSTAESILRSLPETASSIYHVYDRRINLDSLPADPSMYSLLRAWVWDDPYRAQIEPLYVPAAGADAPRMRSSLPKSAPMEVNPGGVLGLVDVSKRGSGVIEEMKRTVASAKKRNRRGAKKMAPPKV
jgi:hypothetical protein